MRRLLVARHAKSSWADAGLADRDRPLNARGRRDAPRVGAALRALGLVPDRALCSASVRTRETWTLMESRLASRARVEHRSDLYLASAEFAMDLVARAPADARALMVLGHNPGSHALAARLARSGDAEKLARLQGAFPTGAVAAIELSGADWSEAAQGGELIEFLVPRRLEEWHALREPR